MRMTIVPIVIGAFGTVTTIIKGPGGLGSWRTSGDHPKDQNTEKSPEDLRRLATTQTPVKNIN